MSCVVCAGGDKAGLSSQVVLLFVFSPSIEDKSLPHCQIKKTQTHLQVEKLPTAAALGIRMQWWCFEWQMQDVHLILILFDCRAQFIFRSTTKCQSSGQKSLLKVFWFCPSLVL